MKNHLVQLIQYNQWANNKVFRRLKEVSPDLYRKQIQSVFPSIAEALAHMYVVDRFWLAVMSGDENAAEMVRTLPTEINEISAEELASRFGEVAEEYRSFLAAESDFSRSVVFVHPARGRFEQPLYEMVHHIVNHGTYHRGNITAMLRQMGEPGATSDYAEFLHVNSI